MADLIKSRADVVQEAYGILTVSSEVAPAEDYDKINAQWEPLLDQLSADTIVTIGDPDQIPTAFFLPLVRLLANVSGPSFGNALNDEAQARDERILRRLNAGRPTYETLRAEYF